MSRRHLGMLIVLSAIWGSSFLFIKVGVRDLAPSTLVLLRVGIAALALLPVTLAIEGYARTGSELRRAWWPLLLVGLGNSAVPFWFLSWGETRLDSGLAAVIQASAPIFSALLAWRFITSQRVTGVRLAGVLVGFLGVALLVGVQPSGAVLGALAVIVTALCYAGATLYAGRALAGVSPLLIAFGSMIAATLSMLPFGIAQAPSSFPGWKAVASVLVLGVVCSAVAYLLYFEIILGAGASRAILVTYLVPAIALLYGAVFLSEHVTLSAVVGLGLVLAGVALGTGAFALRRRRPARLEV
ncbi:MAG: DMT family transporter [Gaiellaceae bacterium]